MYGAGPGAWTNLVGGDFLNRGRPGVAFGNFSAATVGMIANTNQIGGLS